MFPILFSFSPALAQEPVVLEAERERTSGQKQGQGGQSGQKQGQGGGQKQGGQKQGQNNKKKEPHWEGSWYAEPTGGATVYSSGGTAATAVSLGGQAGYRYTLVNTPLPTWSGQTRVAGTYSTNSGGLQGIDVRLGSFIGPSWKDFGVQFGPDVFWNRLVGAGTADLDPTLGLEIPVNASYHVSPLTLSAGVSPAWLSNPARRVDWDTVDSALPGFGHEFTYRAGVGMKIDNFNVGGSYTYRIVASGVQQGVSLNIGF